MRTFRVGVLLLLVLAMLATAQEFRGKIQGTVTDKSGGMVVGSKVKLTNIATGVVSATESNSAGHYIFNFAQPGAYTVSAEMQGFSKAVQENVTVAVSGDVTVNLTLAVGAITSTVTVAETPPDLKFDSATLDTVITESLVKSLPSESRNPFALALLDPTITFDMGGGGLEPYMVWGAASLTVGGGRVGQGELLVDGSPSKIGTMSGYIPNMDAVQEFAVQSNGADAEMGNSGGGVITLVTKSGSNGWHGTALFEGRDPSLNANVFKYNTPSTGTKKIENFSLGNPIKKNKLFLFSSIEHWDLSPESGGLTSTQPTDAERVGDFSKSLNKDGSLRLIFDPNTTVTNTATNTATRTAYAGNVMPGTSINPASAALMKYIWKPNRTPDDPSGTNNFHATEFHTENYWNISEKADWVVTDKLRISGHYSRNWDNTHMNGAGTVAEVNYWEGRSTYNQSITGNVTYMLTPSMILDVRANFAGLNQLFPTESLTLPYDQWKTKYFAGADWGKQYYNGASGLRFPGLSIGGENGYGMALGWQQYGKSWSVLPKIQMTRGRHNLKVGVDIRQQQTTDGWPAGPSFGFGQDATASTYINPNLSATGDGYASFLAGGLSWGNAPYLPALKPRENTFAVFFQDDLKLNSRVTLNVGLRADFDKGPYEDQNRLMIYANPTGSLPALASAGVTLPDPVNQIRSQYGIAAPTWQGGVVFASDSHRNLFNPATQLEPRVGAAIKLNDKMSLRLAYSRWAVPAIATLGAFQMPTGISWGGGGMTAYGYYANTNAQGFVAGKPTSALDNPFPGGLVAAQGNTLGAYTQLGSAVTWNRQAFRAPVSDRMNVSLQRELPGKIVVDATYVYQYGTNIQPPGTADGATYMTNYNIVDPRIRATLKSQLDASVPNPFYNILSPSQFPGELRGYPTVSVAQLIQPYPYYTGFTERDRPGLHNKYNSIQIKAVKPLSNGVQFMAFYAHDVNKLQQFLGNTMDEFSNAPRYLADGNPYHRVSVVAL